MPHAPHFECYFCSRRNTLRFIFYFTAAGVVPCGGRKKSPSTPSIAQIIFYFSPLILNDQKILIGLDACSRSSFLVLRFLLDTVQSLNRLPYQIKKNTVCLSLVFITRLFQGH